MNDEYIPIEIKAPPLVLLLCLISLASVTSVLYTPALPDLCQYFKISSNHAASSMYFFLLFVAIGCLIYGPISNRLGRKITIYIGLGIAIAGGILSLLAGLCYSFTLFNTGRMLQALGGAAGLQVGFTMIGDCYRPPKSLKVTSYVSLGFSIGPSLGVALGGILTHAFGWKGCFYLITLYPLVLMILSIWWLPETLLIKHKDALKIGIMLSQYWVKCKKFHIPLGGAIMGCVVVIPYLFSVIAPFIGIISLKLSSRAYGFYNLFPLIGQVSGCLLAAGLTRYMTATRKIFLGFVIVISCSLLFLFMFSMGVVNVWTLFLPFSVLLIGQCLIHTSVSGLTLHYSVNKSLTSALLLFINMLFCTLIVFLTHSYQWEHLLIMPISFLSLGCLAIVLYCGVHKMYKQEKH